MDIRILRLLEGAKKAEGITVIIDVFRAFTLEAYMFAQNAYSIRPIASLEEARELKQRDPEALLFGERGGARAEGCDFGNSPSSIFGTDLTGKRIIHTTSAGTCITKIQLIIIRIVISFQGQFGNFHAIAYIDDSCIVEPFNSTDIIPVPRIF